MTHWLLPLAYSSMARNALFQSSAGVLLAATLFALASGCTGSTQQQPTIAPPKPIPSVVTDATYAEVERRYWMLGLESPGRTALRDRLLAFLLARGPRPQS